MHREERLEGGADRLLVWDELSAGLGETTVLEEGAVSGSVLFPLTRKHLSWGHCSQPCL